MCVSDKLDSHIKVIVALYISSQILVESRGVTVGHCLNPVHGSCGWWITEYREAPFSEVKVLVQGLGKNSQRAPPTRVLSFLVTCHEISRVTVTFYVTQYHACCHTMPCVTVLLFLCIISKWWGKIALWIHILSWNGVAIFITSWGYYFWNTITSDKSYLFYFERC